MVVASGKRSRNCSQLQTLNRSQSGLEGLLYRQSLDACYLTIGRNSNQLIVQVSQVVLALQLGLAGVFLIVDEPHRRRLATSLARDRIRSSLFKLY